MDICVVGGAGYVGLVTGLGLAETGHQVVNVDLDQNKVERLKQGCSPIFEEGLEPVLRRNLDAKRIRFVTNLDEGVADSQVIIIAVGTPSKLDGQADLSAVIQVAEALVKHLDQYRVVVIKSTVPVGAVELVRSILSRDRREGVDFDIVSNPEFLSEGRGLYDFFYPDRIVVGTGSEKAMQVMREMAAPVILRKVYWKEGGPRPQATQPVPVVETSLASAQMIKYASNAFLATRVSFINEIAWLCERVGADVKEVARGMGYDPRIGPSYLQAGLGFGGPCLEKDLRALIKIAEANGYEPQLMCSVLDQNERQIDHVMNRLKDMVGYLLYQRIITVFGLAFKANTNDVRSSQSLKVIDRLEKEGAAVRCHDPLAVPEAREIAPKRTYVEDPYEAVRQADALLILTEWPQYVALDYRLIRERMANPCVIDTRNILNANAMRSLGFTYAGIGVTRRVTS
ncbi:MAG: UDP-glucose/GDP-mannose dehydrogenase family protein [Chloroflexi bacterium]|nr:UDP-glucose/GDP-mannose dehydrogenase family protein [Chloroflexota bacterium]